MIRRDYEGGLLLISQTSHAWVAGQLAMRWGNDTFMRPEPWEELTLTAIHHDNGWAEWELAPRVHPDGRPVSFLEMALEEHFAIWQRSIERLRVTNLYGAMLVSMHAADLYERRLTDDRRGDTPEVQQRIRDFIDGQRAFQAQMRRALSDHPRYGPALATEKLDDAFRLLQVWDLLSLLLLMGSLPTYAVEDVPIAPGERTVIQLTPQDHRTLTLQPYPFSETPFTLWADGRWLAQRVYRHNTLFRQALRSADLLGLEFVLDRGV
jgi:hypothetical protein